MGIQYHQSQKRERGGWKWENREKSINISILLLLPLFFCFFFLKKKKENVFQWCWKKKDFSVWDIFLIYLFSTLLLDEGKKPSLSLPFLGEKKIYFFFYPSFVTWGSFCIFRQEAFSLLVDGMDGQCIICGHLFMCGVCIFFDDLL